MAVLATGVHVAEVVGDDRHDPTSITVLAITDDMSTLEAALKYAANGCYVGPVEARTNTPDPAWGRTDSAGHRATPR